MGHHDPWTPDLDLGDGHSLIWTTIEGMGADEHYGAIIRHAPGPDVKQHTVDFYGSGICEGGITFDTPSARAFHERYDGGRPFVAWQVQSWDPLTISPSIKCDCGDHGYIREGRWVRA